MGKNNDWNGNYNFFSSLDIGLFLGVTFTQNIRINLKEIIIKRPRNWQRQNVSFHGMITNIKDNYYNLVLL